jgi:hypothetical protein
MVYNFLCAIVLAIVLGFGPGSLKAEDQVASQVATTEQSKDISNVAAHYDPEEEELNLEEEENERVSAPGHTCLGEDDELQHEQDGDED